MKLLLRHLGWSAFALIGLTGCPPTEPPAPTPIPTPGESKPAEPVKPGNAPSARSTEPAKLADDEVAEIKKLPAEDQALALAQVTCPVSDHHLGSGGMGPPLKKVVEGKTFFLCCSGCEGELEKDPKGVLAKLEKK